MAATTSKAAKRPASIPVEDVPRHEVASWSEVQHYLEQFLDGKHIFRGINNMRYPLVPSIGRYDVEGAALRKLEEQFLNRFKREAIPYLHRRPETAWEWLALAQHHGTPTRLLDWSESPYVSLYFAVSGADLDDGGLHVIPRPDDVPFEDGVMPFTIDLPRYFFPDHAAARISAQRGLFTVHPSPTEIYSPAGAHQMIIKAHAKAEIRRKLDAIGIHDSLIFADLDGLSRRLVALERFSRPPTVTPPPVPPTRARPPARAPARAANPNRLPPAALIPPDKMEAVAPKTKINPRDPQKGQWGGKSRNDKWVLTGVVTEAKGNWFHIVLRVAAVAGSAIPLSGEVVFHLHDSFRKDVQYGKLIDSAAVLELTSYGAFTVGVEVKKDGSRLELDLAEDPNAPRRFRER